jgi:phosphatidylglycerophosphate synthase
VLSTGIHALASLNASVQVQIDAGASTSAFTTTAAPMVAMTTIPTNVVVEEVETVIAVVVVTIATNAAIELQPAAAVVTDYERMIQLTIIQCQRRRRQCAGRTFRPARRGQFTADATGTELMAHGAVADQRKDGDWCERFWQW